MAAARLDEAATEERAMLRTLDRDVRGKLESHGMVFNAPEPGTFRGALEKAGFYAEWKGKFGNEAWALLERYSGKLG
jgi:TRAP-type C4-dicarboxylate transport system substrate-binding protein